LSVQLIDLRSAFHSSFSNSSFLSLRLSSLFLYRFLLLYLLLVFFILILLLPPLLIILLSLQIPFGSILPSLTLSLLLLCSSTSRGLKTSSSPPVQPQEKQLPFCKQYRGSTCCDNVQSTVIAKELTPYFSDAAVHLSLFSIRPAN
jgi:hypothetical protein